jgi:hypothetical protein
MAHRVRIIQARTVRERTGGTSTSTSSNSLHMRMIQAVELNKKERNIK